MVCVRTDKNKMKRLHMIVCCLLMSSIHFVSGKEHYFDGSPHVVEKRSTRLDNPDHAIPTADDNITTVVCILLVM